MGSVSRGTREASASVPQHCMPSYPLCQRMYECPSLAYCNPKPKLCIGCLCQTPAPSKLPQLTPRAGIRLDVQTAINPENRQAIGAISAGKADLHAHSCQDAWGDGNASVAQLFDFVETHTDLCLFGISDHDSTAGARAGQELHSRGSFRFDFLPGTEVTTTSGHVLCYFPDEVFDVPSLRSLAWTSQFVHEHGGFCVLAHPVYPPWLNRDLRGRQASLEHVEAVEVANSGLSPRAQSRLAELQAVLEGRVALVGNSDAHHLGAIGSSYTTFPGRNRHDYIQALRDGSTTPFAGTSTTMKAGERSFTRRRSMTRPGWVRNVYREASQRLWQGEAK